MSGPLITVCMIARNEEATIGEALGSLYTDNNVPLWDELIVTLAGTSVDATETIARGFGAQIARYPASGAWPTDADGRELRDYGAAREATESLATGRYVFWIDADERLIRGHDVIRRIAEQARLPGVRPRIRLIGGIEHARQELLHRRGMYHWKGAIHERLEGIPVPVERGILYEEIARPDGDRPHGEMFELLRTEMGTTLKTRELYYLAREHLNEQQWAQGIACGRLFLDAGGGWPEQRSQMHVYLAQAWIALGDVHQARQSYLEAIKEFGPWCEPYYGLAVLHRDLGLYLEAVMWAAAALVPAFDSDDDMQAEARNPEVYAWRRFDVMAFCLAALGRYEEAARYYDMVERAHPNEVTIANVRRCRELASGGKT